MASQNSDSKSTQDLIIQYLNSLNSIIENYNTSTFKVRDDLFKFVESNKQNNINSDLYCDDKLNNYDKEIASLPKDLQDEVSVALSKHEARVEINNSQLEAFKNDLKNSFKNSAEEYESVVNEENDELDNKQYLYKKEYKDYLKSIDSEEVTQKRELTNSINAINIEIEELSNKLNSDVETLRQEFKEKATVYNDEMRKIRNEFVIKEKNLRSESKEETINHHRQIENLTKHLINKQKETNNLFSQNLLGLSNSYDELYAKYKDSPIRLLEEQNDNKVRKGILEINKNYKIRLDKEQNDTQIRNLKILKQHLDNQLTTRINRINIESLIDISKFEKESRYEDAIKENKISEISLTIDKKIKILLEKLNDKKNELSYFTKRFAVLRDFKKTTTDLYSHLSDINTTLKLDLNQLEKDSVLEHTKHIINVKAEDTDTLNLVSEFEYNKEVIAAELKYNLNVIEFEKKKLLTKYDNILFKTRSNFNVEKTRIESILKMFEIKYDKEIATLKNDIAFINAVGNKVMEEITIISSPYIDNAKNNKENSKEIIGQFYKMIQAEYSYVFEQIEEYFSDQSLRFTPDIDEMIEEYLSSTLEKKENLNTDLEEIKSKKLLCQAEVFELENDIMMLESQKRILINKGKKEFSGYVSSYRTEAKKKHEAEVMEMETEIENKNRELRYANERLKSLSKDISDTESVIAKIDEGASIFAKKESQKLIDLKLDNHYYDNYDELQDLHSKLNSELNDIVEDALSKSTIDSMYKLISKCVDSIDKFLNQVKMFYNNTYLLYKEQFEKIRKICELNLSKEEHTNEININSANRERNIAIEDINNKIILANRNARELENKADADIINAKEMSDERKKKAESDLELYDRNYGLRLEAIKSNIDSIKRHYSAAIFEENRKLDRILQQQSKERLKNKKIFESNLAKIEADNIIEAEKMKAQCRARLLAVEKQHINKLKDFDLQNMQLDNVLLKSSKECDLKINESNSQLGDFIKQLENQKQGEIKKYRADSFKKLKHEKKKLMQSLSK